VFSSQTTKTVFDDFFLDFWVNVFEVFKQDLLMIIWSKETSFGFEKNLGRIASIFLENFTLQVINPLFLEND